MLFLTLKAAAAASIMLAPSAAAPQAPPAPAAEGGIAVNINITPRRVTLDRDTRTAAVYVFNQGEEPAVFDIALVDRVMLPTGEIRAVEEAAAAPEWSPYAERLRSGADMVVATPRRVTLQPGAGQTVRLRANPPADAAAGEYRTHLTVTNVPPPEAGLTAEQAAAEGADELVFRIQSIFGLSIPVIIRTATPDVRARIENIQMVSAETPATDTAPAGVAPALRFDIVREGESSIFGNLEIRGADGDEPIGVARGVGVYPEIDRRSAQILLTRAPAPGETLSVVLTDDDTQPGVELARVSFQAL